MDDAKTEQFKKITICSRSLKLQITFVCWFSGLFYHSYLIFVAAINNKPARICLTSPFARTNS